LLDNAEDLKKWGIGTVLYRLIHDGPRKLFDLLTGAEWTKWSRVVMSREMRSWVRDLKPETLDVLEISGSAWENFGFKSYRNTSYPDFDICEGTLHDQQFDLIVADQVFEHLLWPYRAGSNVYQMLRPDGYFLLSTPFLVRVHGEVDCSRWTEIGLKHLLAECGFDLEQIRTASWGNRACVKSNLQLRSWTRYRRYLHPLKNEPHYPYTVWALAKKEQKHKSRSWVTVPDTAENWRRTRPQTTNLEVPGKPGLDGITRLRVDGLGQISLENALAVLVTGPAEAKLFEDLGFKRIVREFSWRPGRGANEDGT
jgi:SAM-dependent methyltransferase